MNDGVTSDVFTPRIGEIIDVSTKQNMFELTLSDSLFKSIDFFKKGDYEIAYVSGKLLYDPEYDSSHIGKYLTLIWNT